MNNRVWGCMRFMPLPGLLRYPVDGFNQVLYHLLGGAVPFGPFLDEILQEDRIYSPDGREDGVCLLNDVGVGYVALLDHLLDPPDMTFHALEPARHLALGLLLQGSPPSRLDLPHSLPITVASWKGTSPSGRCWSGS